MKEEFECLHKSGRKTIEIVDATRYEGMTLTEKYRQIKYDMNNEFAMNDKIIRIDFLRNYED